MSAARMPDFRVNDLDERMGSPTELAIFAAEQYRARSFFGRHPIFTFLVGAAAVAVGDVGRLSGSRIGRTAAMGIWLSCRACVWACRSPDGDHPCSAHVLSAVLSWELIVVAAAYHGVAAVSRCRTAMRLIGGGRWRHARCWPSWWPCFNFVAADDLTCRTNGVFMIGIRRRARPSSWLFLTWLPKFALALGIGLALVWREQRRDRGEISDSAATLSTLPAA